MEDRSTSPNKPPTESSAHPVVDPNKPSATRISADIIDSEQSKRKLFEYTIWFAFGCIAALYLTLICWVHGRAKIPYIFGGSSEVWHIATILALPPTTILFLLIKVLSKNTEQNNNNYNSNLPINIKDMPVSELFSQIMKMIEDIKSTITGKK